MKTTGFLIIMLGLACVAHGQKLNNPELQKMYDEDQGSRMKANIDWSVVGKQDSMREVRVYQLMKQGKVITSRDHYNAAMIFQHGDDTVASAMAVRHMKEAVVLDSTINKWLLAAAIDRDLMRRGKPQIYGTQYTKSSMQDVWKRYTIDTTQITDAERKRYGVETLAEQKVKERRMNMFSLSDYYATGKSVDQMVQFIQTEQEKGDNATYNVSESAINSFGYQIMGEHKLQEALTIFKLNTELYPTGYNTFDSYGECLLKLNRKAEALQAYRQSLILNPKNENARKVLSENKE